MLESTLNQLYNSAVNAFPNTTARQHLTKEIRLIEYSWLPFIGVKTLFLKTTAKNEDRAYNPMILFKGVNYTNEGKIEITATDGKSYRFNELTTKDVLVRCQCADFFWRFHNEDKVDKSLYSSNRKKYESKGLRGPVNPMHKPGLCKHLMSLMEALQDVGVLGIID